MPVLAESWDASSDATTYTIHMRQSAHFSDGNPSNAYTTWANFYIYYYLNGNFSAFWGLVSIFDFTGVNFGPATLALMAQDDFSHPSSQLLQVMSNTAWPVYVTDAYTIVFHLVGPYLFFTNSFSAGIDLMVDPAFLFQHGGPGAPGNPNSYFILNPPPGTGPYVVTKVVPGSEVEFQQDPNYWGRSLTAAEIAANPILDPGHFKKIVVLYKPSGTTRYIDLTTGQAQVAAVTGSEFKLAQANPALGVASFNYPATQVYVAMNTKIFPTNITDVRLAIVHAINYTAVIDQAVSGQGLRYVGPETPSYGEYYNPGNLAPYEYNVTEAATLLAAAGFPDGNGLPALTFTIDADGLTWEAPAAELIQQDLSQIGISVNIQVIPTGLFYSATAFAFSYDTNLQNPSVESHLALNGYAGYAPDYLGPVDYWSAFVSNSSLFGNQAIYASPAVNNAIELMTHSSDKAAILTALTAAQLQVNNDAPYAWLFVAKLPFVSGTYAFDNKVVGKFYLDYALMGVSDLPILNTITSH